MALRRPHKGMKMAALLQQGIRLAACVYVPRAEAPGFTSLQTPDFSPGELGCLAHRPIFTAMTMALRRPYMRDGLASPGGFQTRPYDKVDDIVGLGPRPPGFRPPPE